MKTWEMKAEPMWKALAPMKATLLDDDAFRLLAIPFSGPVPYPGAPKGADIEGQWFGPETDIKPDWFKARVVDWHHSTPHPEELRRGDVKIGKATLGKAVDLGNADGPADEPDEDGWWVTVWLDAGQRRLDLIRRLAARGAQIFGSSETLPGLPQMRLAGKADIAPWARGVPGEIVVWPYMRQTLSTSPQNTNSVLRPIKAVLDNLSLDENAGDLMRDLLADLYALGADLTATSPAGVLIPNQPARELPAKAGRVLSAVNERALREALAKLDEVLAKLRAGNPEENHATE